MTNIEPTVVAEEAAQGGDGTPQGPEREFTVEARSQTQMVLSRFVRHKAAMTSLVILLFVILLSLVGGRFWKYDYSEITSEFSTGPTLEHPFGTDGVGHDVFAQVLRGAQKSVQIMLLVALFSTTIGVLVGAIAGYYRGLVDSVLARFIDLLLTVPLIVILIVLSKIVEDSGN
ncbi:hypothetical protein BH18ACT4_BH18ACT4_02270 [soil metagenome]